jgi:peptidoglycan/LPS O-acetylase OafA/YrhL
MFAACSCCAAVAVFLRFAAVRLPLFDSIAENAYGIYLFHYVFVIWAQYALLGLALPAVAKATFVFAATLALSWATSIAACRAPLGARLIGGRWRPPAPSRVLAGRQIRQDGLSSYGAQSDAENPDLRSQRRVNLP